MRGGRSRWTRSNWTWIEGHAPAGAEVTAALHPLLTHHVVNSLGWSDLRPLQKQALHHILAGEHVLLVAPTAGGKTEAVVFPLLSRILEEDWPPLSVLYLCPLRALLNNLHPRIEHYAGLVGRTAGLWHGDVGESARENDSGRPARRASNDARVYRGDADLAKDGARSPSSGTCARWSWTRSMPSPETTVDGTCSP